MSERHRRVATLGKPWASGATSRRFAGAPVRAHARRGDRRLRVVSCETALWAIPCGVVSRTACAPHAGVAGVVLLVARPGARSETTRCRGVHVAERRRAVPCQRDTTSPSVGKRLVRALSCRNEAEAMSVRILRWCYYLAIASLLLQLMRKDLNEDDYSATGRREGCVNGKARSGGCGTCRAAR
jgi:hypothetical protein